MMNRIATWYLLVFRFIWGNKIKIITKDLHSYSLRCLLSDKCTNVKKKKINRQFGTMCKSVFSRENCSHTHDFLVNMLLQSHNFLPNCRDKNLTDSFNPNPGERGGGVYCHATQNNNEKCLCSDHNNTALIK